MRDSIRKLLVPGLFLSVVAGVWALGAVKADLDLPTRCDFRVDPAIVRAALLADPSADASSDSSLAENADWRAATSLFAS